MTTLLEMVLSNAILAAFLAVLAAAVACWCRRPAIVHGLWLLVLLKLLTPPLVQLPLEAIVPDSAEARPTSSMASGSLDATTPRVAVQGTDTPTAKATLDDDALRPRETALPADARRDVDRSEPSRATQPSWWATLNWLDAWVRWTYPELAKGYAETLLQTVDFLGRTYRNVPQLASGAVSARPLKRRLEMILHHRIRPDLSPAKSAAFLVAATLVLPLSVQALWVTQPATAAAPAALSESPDKSSPDPSRLADRAAEEAVPQPPGEKDKVTQSHKIDLSRIKSSAWQRAIQRATKHPALQAGNGQFTLLRVVLDGVALDRDIVDQWEPAADDKDDAEAKRAANKPEPVPMIPVPRTVNGVDLFLPPLPRDWEPDWPKRDHPTPAANNPSGIQLSSVKLVDLKQLAGGGRYHELCNGEFVLVEHINSTARVAGRDPIDLGSYSHGQATVAIAVPPRGQLGIAGDVVLLRPPMKNTGKIVAEVRFKMHDPLMAERLQVGPLVVGGRYGHSYKFDEDGVCQIDALPAGTYRLLLPDFDVAKSRWEVAVKPGRITRLIFVARSKKVVELMKEESLPSADEP